MSNDLASLLLDIVILILLGATIFYVIRLTKGLKEFKEHRQEFDSVIANLLASIDQADHSVRMLKKVSAEESSNLEQNVARAMVLSDELKMINETGENMAKRLEKLAEKNRKIVQPAQGAIFSKNQNPSRFETGEGEESKEKISSPVHRDKGNKKKGGYSATLKRIKKKAKGVAHDLPSFMAEKSADYKQVDDFDPGVDNDVNNDVEKDGGDVAAHHALRSQAEKDLMNALRATRKKISDNE